MIDPECLQHAPETMGEMNGQSRKGNNIEESIEKVAEQILYGDGKENIFGVKG